MRRKIFSSLIGVIMFMLGMSFCYAAEITGEITLDGTKTAGDVYTDSVIVHYNIASDVDLKSIIINVNGKEFAKKSLMSDSKSVGKRAEGDFDIPKSFFKKNKTGDNNYDLEIVVVNVDDEQEALPKKTFKAYASGPEISISGVSNRGIYNVDKTISVKYTDEDADKTQEAPTTAADNETNAETGRAAKLAETDKANTKMHVVVKRGDKVVVDKDANEDTYSYEATEEGTYSIVATVSSGRTTVAEETRTFTIDKTEPTIGDIKIIESNLDGTDWYVTGVSFDNTVKDELSGLKNIVITVNGKTVETISCTNEMSKSFTAKIDEEWLLKNENADGEYEITIIAQDNASNKSTKKIKIKIDVTAPEVSLSGVKNGGYTNQSPKIVLSSPGHRAKNNKNTMTIKKDGNEYKTVEGTGDKLYFSEFEGDGYYEISAISEDDAGRVSEPATISFTKDTVKPVISLAGAQADSFTEGAKDISVSVNELNYSNMTVTATIVKRLDGNKKKIAFGDIKPTSSQYSQSKRINGTGTYTVTIEAVDAAGNKANTRKLKFTIDNDKPIIKISGVNESNGYDSTVTPIVKFKDSYLKSKKITLTRASGKKVTKLAYKDDFSTTGGQRTYSNFQKQKKFDDTYTLTCTVTDKVGNTVTKKTTFVVNRFGSRYNTTATTKKVNGEYCNSVDEDLQIVERNVSDLKTYDVEVIKDGDRSQASLTPVESNKKGWKTYTYTFDKNLFREEGVYEVNLMSTDAVENFSEYKEKEGVFKFAVDRTAPTISVAGIEDNGRYKGSTKAKITVSDAIKMKNFKVYCDGDMTYDSKKVINDNLAQEVTIPSGYGQTVQIVATDASGNVSKATIRNVTVSESFFVRLMANKLFVVIASVCVILMVGTAFILVRKRRY